MPRSAILTGAVDLVLPVGKISEILAKYGRRKGLAPDDHPPDRLTEIVDFLRTKTLARFLALQARHIVAADRAAHGVGRCR